ncbi:hypothetical protein [Lentzea flava]|nr:hypothetical protein [Lentzea flava]
MKSMVAENYVPDTATTVSEVWKAIGNTFKELATDFNIPIIVVAAIAFMSSLGTKSLWLSIFGDTVDDRVVTERSSHTPRRSPTYYWNELSCGPLRITYQPGPGYSTKPVGERIDLADYAEPGTIVAHTRSRARRRFLKRVTACPPRGKNIRPFGRNVTERHVIGHNLSTLPSTPPSSGYQTAQ